MNEYILEEIDNASDRRVRKTKKALRSALFSLINEKPINRITVKEITELADVNRSTFYLYYTDVYDMFDKIQDDIYNLFITRMIPTDVEFIKPKDFSDYIKKFLIFCKENPETCRFIIRNETNNQLARRIKEAIMANLPDSHKRYPAEDPRHHLTTFAVYGIIFTITEWFESGMKAPIDELADFLSNTYVFGSVSQKLENFSDILKNLGVELE